MSEPNPYTIGIEEEFPVVDLKTMALKPVPAPLLRTGLKEFHDHLHREMNLSTVELTSDVLANIHDATDSVRSSRKQLAELLARKDLGIASSGTHPFADWRRQGVVEDDRHSQMLRKFRHAIRSCVIFGLHVHVSMPDRHVGLQIANGCYQFIPLLLALSSNSPFYDRQDTGFRSFRSELFLQRHRPAAPLRYP